MASVTLHKGDVKVDTGSVNDYVAPFTAGGTFAAGDLVKLSSGTVVIAAENDTAALGWAMHGATSGDTCLVLKGAPGVKVVMATNGTDAVTTLGGVYELAGSTGAFTVDLDATSNTFFTIHEVDTTNELALVSFYNTTYQLT